MFTASAVFVVILAILAIVIVMAAVKVVPQGNEYTVERFGRFTNTLSPGLHLILPIIDRVGRRLNMMEQVMDVPVQEIITKDNAMVAVDGVVFYQVMDAPKAAYEVRQLELAILNLTMTNIRSVMGGMDLDELLSKRDEINSRLLAVVDEATDPWGVKITRIEIKDINPPRDLVDSMARQMKAEREKRADILQADGHKQAAILEAEGRRESAFRDAEAREREAQAEAEATRMVSIAISEGDVQAINYFVAQKYVDALGRIATSPNQKMFFMPLEASSVIGAIGGVSELAREAMQKQAEGRAARSGSVPNVQE